MNKVIIRTPKETRVYFDPPSRDYLIEKYHKYGEYLKAEKRLDWLFFDDEQLKTIEWWLLDDVVIGMADKVNQVISSKLDFPEDETNQDNEEN